MNNETPKDDSSLTDDTASLPDNKDQPSSGLDDDGLSGELEVDTADSGVMLQEEALPKSNVTLDEESSAEAVEREESLAPATDTFDATPAANVEQRFPVTEALKPGNKVNPDYALQFTHVTDTELNDVLTRQPLNSLGTSPDVAKWAVAVGGAERSILRGEALRGAVEREDSNWRQSVRSDSLELHAGRPKLGEESLGEKLTGLAAKSRMQSLLGLGSPVRIPLWHSGMWLVLNTPSEGALLELDRRIGNEKILLGRLTNGMIFSHTSVYTSMHLVNFVLAHVHDATARFADPMDLKAMIKSTDIPAMIWGLMLSVYPNGYPFQEPCVKDPAKCNHVVEEMLNLSKIQWTDERSLTEFQRKLMQRRNSKFTPEELKRYQDEQPYHQYKTVELHPNLSMDLHVPSIQEYETLGTAWVDDIVKAVDRSTSGALDEKDRNAYIMEQASTSALNQYGHWIERLTLKRDGSTEVIEDRDSITENLTLLVSNEDIATKFLDGIGKFIDRATISLIALPKYNCPSCGEPMNAEYKAHPHLAPLDVMSSFFTIQTQLTNRVLNRSMM